MSLVRFAVCEAPADLSPNSGAWHDIVARTHALDPHVLLLNELPFGPWIATTPMPRADQCLVSHQLHVEGLKHLVDLRARHVLGTRAVLQGDRLVNEAFIWCSTTGITTAHTKQFFPDEEGFHEARWYTRGKRRFQLANVGPLRVAFLICTDVMFGEWARYYGRQGAHVIAVPRATPAESLERWKTVLSATAIVSGCYVVSSNRVGSTNYHLTFGGGGWIFHPSGELIAETSPDSPIVVAGVDPTTADAAKHGYPCYVTELPTGPDDPRD